MVPEKLFEPETLEELKRFSSKDFDKFLDKIIESANESFLKSCSQQADNIKELNLCRLSVIKTLERLKTENITDDE
jgi:mRNA-degrading endonuclease RelE of RelBE toxin-antitoxin system